MQNKTQKEQKTKSLWEKYGINLQYTKLCYDPVSEIVSFFTFNMSLNVII